MADNSVNIFLELPTYDLKIIHNIIMCLRISKNISEKSNFVLDLIDQMDEEQLKQASSAVNIEIEKRAKKEVRK